MLKYFDIGFTMPIGAQSMPTSSYQQERFQMRYLAFQVMDFMFTKTMSGSC